MNIAKVSNLFNLILIFFNIKKLVIYVEEEVMESYTETMIISLKDIQSMQHWISHGGSSCDIINFFKIAQPSIVSNNHYSPGIIPKDCSLARYMETQTVLLRTVRESIALTKKNFKKFEYEKTRLYNDLICVEETVLSNSKVILRLDASWFSR